MSLCPNGVPASEQKKTSSVSGIQTGASEANAYVGFDAISRIVALTPKMSRKASSKTWKKGGVLLVGLKSSVKVSSRKVAFGLITAFSSKSMIWVFNRKFEAWMTMIGH